MYRRREISRMDEIQKRIAKRRLISVGNCLQVAGSKARPTFLIAGKSEFASRGTLELKLGRRLMPGECACHTCDNGLCINPDHLFAGTQKDNLQDASRKGRLYLQKIRGTEKARRSAQRARASQDKIEVIGKQTVTRDMFVRMYKMRKAGLSCAAISKAINRPSGVVSKWTNLRILRARLWSKSLETDAEILKGAE